MVSGQWKPIWRMCFLPAYVIKTEKTGYDEFFSIRTAGMASLPYALDIFTLAGFAHFCGNGI
jgi:hypothetical protein